MKLSQIKVGSKICLNPHFLDIWWQAHNGKYVYFPNDIKGRVMTVSSINPNRFMGNDYWNVAFSDDDDNRYSVEILTTGEFYNSVREEIYKSIDVFISIGKVATSPVNTQFCSCSNPNETTIVIGFSVRVCRNCKKEME